MMKNTVLVIKDTRDHILISKALVIWFLRYVTPVMNIQLHLLKYMMHFNMTCPSFPDDKMKG